LGRDASANALRSTTETPMKFARTIIAAGLMSFGDLIVAKPNHDRFCVVQRSQVLLR
jgi:hypothetical protein